jgi:hypothetical protein
MGAHGTFVWRLRSGTNLTFHRDSSGKSTPAIIVALNLNSCFRYVLGFGGAVGGGVCAAVVEQLSSTVYARV